MGFSNMMDYVKVTSDGDGYVDLSELSREQAAAITEVTVDDYWEGRRDDAREIKRIRVKLADKKGPLELLGKHLKLFTEKYEHAGPGGGPINIVEVTTTHADGPTGEATEATDDEDDEPAATWP